MKKVLFVLYSLCFNLFASDENWTKKEQFIEEQVKISNEIDLNECQRGRSKKLSSNESVKEKLAQCNYEKKQETAKLEKKQRQMMAKYLNRNHKRTIASEDENDQYNPEQSNAEQNPPDQSVIDSNNEEVYPDVQNPEEQPAEQYNENQ